MLEEAISFQKLHKSLSRSPIFSGLLALLKLSLDSFSFLVHPIQGESVKEGGILIVAANANELAFPILVGLLEDGEDGPPRNPIEANP